MNYEEKIARTLLDIKAIRLSPDEPFHLKSKLLAPLYIDNRVFPFHPKEWRLVIFGFVRLIVEHKIPYDVIGGIATAGIPHSAALAFHLKQPSIFVRKEEKNHGLIGKRVEGGDIAGMNVLLIEDHVTTGASSLAGIDAIHGVGGSVRACLSITSHESREAKEAFAAAAVSLYTLTTLRIVLEQARQMKILTTLQVDNVQAFLSDPIQWSEHHQDKDEMQKL